MQSLTIILDPELAVAAHRHHYRPMVRRRLRHGIALGVVLVAIGVYELARSPDADPFMLVLGLLVGCAMVFGQLKWWRIDLPGFIAANLLDREVEVELSAGQVVCRSAKQTRRSDWSDFVQAREFPDMILSYWSPDAFAIWPKRQLSEEQLRFLRERLGLAG